MIITSISNNNEQEIKVNKNLYKTNFKTAPKFSKTVLFDPMKKFKFVFFSLQEQVLSKMCNIFYISWYHTQTIY